MTIATVLVAVSLSAAPIKIAAPDLEGVGLTDEHRAFFTSHLAQQLQMRGLSVISAADIRALISQERQKQLLGCGESESCAVEIGNALGADTLLTGTIARLGTSYQVNLKVMSAVDGKPLALWSGTATGEEAVVPALNLAAEKLAGTLLEKEIPRRPSTTEQTKQLFTDSERRDGQFIVRNDPMRESGRRILLGGLIGLPIGVTCLLIARAVPIFFIPGITITAASVIAVPLGLVMYFIGKQERVPAVNASLMVGDRNRLGFALSYAF